MKRPACPRTPDCGSSVRETKGDFHRDEAEQRPLWGLRLHSVDYSVAHQRL